MIGTKMKKFLVLLVVLLPIEIFAQTNYRFIMTDEGISNTQNPSVNYIVFELDSLKSQDIKQALFSVLSRMFTSPKYSITEVSDNVISIEGYASGFYIQKIEENSYTQDFSYVLIIEYKDGKIRYNNPRITQIYIDSPLGGKIKFNMELPLPKLIEKDEARQGFSDYFYKLVSQINLEIKSYNEW